MKADAPATQAVHAGQVFGLLGAAHEEDHPVAHGGVGVFFDTPGNAFFGQETLDEFKVALAVLHAVAALATVAGKQALGDVFRHARVPVPGGQLRVVGEDVFDDLHNAGVLPNPAAQGVVEQGDPGLQQQGLAGKAAVGLQRARFGDHAAARDLAAIGQARGQRDGTRVEVFERDAGVKREDVDAQLEGLGDGFVQLKALDQQVSRQGLLGVRGRQRVQPGVLRPRRQQPGQVRQAWQIHGP